MLSAGSEGRQGGPTALGVEGSRAQKAGHLLLFYHVKQLAMNFPDIRHCALRLCFAIALCDCALLLCFAVLVIDTQGRERGRSASE